MKPLLKVKFVVHPDRLNFGSTELRVFQLIRILEQQLGEKASFTVEPLPSRRRYAQDIWALKQKKDEIIVFSKVALSELRGRTLDILQFKGVKTCIDYVDTDLRKVLKFRCDVHIAASLTSLRLMEDLRADAANGPKPVTGKLFLVHHNTDLRLSGATLSASEGLRTAYFGDLRNTVHSEEIAKHVAFIDIRRTGDLEELGSDLSHYNFHYCIRRPFEKRPGELVAKPFTKGFIASQMGVPVIIDRSVDDAVELLGEDYPFIVDDNSEAAILDGLRKAEASFGGPDWDLAQTRMNAMKQVFSHQAITRQFCDITDHLRATLS